MDINNISQQCKLLSAGNNPVNSIVCGVMVCYQYVIICFMCYGVLSLVMSKLCLWCYWMLDWRRPKSNPSQWQTYYANTIKQKWHNTLLTPASNGISNRDSRIRTTALHFHVWSTRYHVLHLWSFVLGCVHVLTPGAQAHAEELVLNHNKKQ